MLNDNLQRLPVPASGERVPATLVERVRHGPMIAGGDDQLSRTALHELRFGRLHEHSTDATPVIIRRDSQCHDLAVPSVGFCGANPAGSPDTNGFGSAAAEIIRVVGPGRWSNLTEAASACAGVDRTRHAPGFSV